MLSAERELQRMGLAGRGEGLLVCFAFFFISCQHVTTQYIFPVAPCSSGLLKYRSIKIQSFFADLVLNECQQVFVFH